MCVVFRFDWVTTPYFGKNYYSQVLQMPAFLSELCITATAAAVAPDSGISIQTTITDVPLFLEHLYTPVPVPPLQVFHTYWLNPGL